MEKKDFKYLVRIANTDLDGHKKISHALIKIKGIKVMLANAICLTAHIDKDKKAGTLNQEEIKAIDEIIQNPIKFSIPEWMFNRRNDVETGINKHLVGADLDFAKQEDIRRMKKLKSYRGVRHIHGLPVRGQTTRSNFRRSKGKVMGVKRKKGKGGRV